MFFVKKWLMILHIVTADWFKVDSLTLHVTAHSTFRTQEYNDAYAFNPSNAESTIVQRTRVQRFLKII